jgi:hypothetical protein
MSRYFDFGIWYERLARALFGLPSIPPLVPVRRPPSGPTLGRSRGWQSASQGGCGWGGGPR